MPTFAVDAVLFDNDGVLVDSHPQVIAAWTQVASEYDLPIEPLLTELAGVRARDTLGKYLDGEDLDTATQYLEDLEIASAGETLPLTGALRLLDALPDGRWTIVTSGTNRLARARWNGAGIPIPPQVVTAEDVGRGKPDPEPFLTGAARLGVDPSRVAVFEDSPSGGAAGLAAGAIVIAVGNQEWDQQPHARVQDLRDVEVFTQPNGSFEMRTP